MLTKVASFAFLAFLWVIAPSSSGARPHSPAQAGGSGGGVTTTAKVEVTDMQGRAINLKSQERVALLFMEAISSMENDCSRHLNRPCPLDELVKGAKAPNWNIGRLKYDPAKDTNYKYSIEISGGKWKAQAVPQNPGIGGFFYDGGSMIAKSYYNPSGPASTDSTRLSEIGISGEIFKLP